MRADIGLGDGSGGKASPSSARAGAGRRLSEGRGERGGDEHVWHGMSAVLNECSAMVMEMMEVCGGWRGEFGGVRGHVGGGACMFAGRRLQLRCRRGLSMRWRGFQSNRSAGARTCNKMPSQFDKSRATIRTRCRCVACGWAAAGEGHQRTLGVLMLFKKCQGQAASILWRSRMQKDSDCTTLHTSNLLSFAVSQPSCPLPPTAGLRHPDIFRPFLTISRCERAGAGCRVNRGSRGPS